MQTFVSVTSEYKRIKELLSFQILDTPNEEEFDNLVKVVARIFNAPVVAITFLDEKRQWIKASVGLNFCETERKYAVCNYTIRQYGITEIPDLSIDERFSSFPFVAGAPFYRYYAGFPLKTESGYLLGALCIMDFKTRHLRDEEKELLAAFARSVMSQVEISARYRMFTNINEARGRICCAISRYMQDPTQPIPQLEGLPEYQAEYLTSVNGLHELDNLLMQEADNINKELMEMKRQKRIALRGAVESLQCPCLKQLTLGYLKDMETETLVEV